jgi:sialate O-acetylesterase
LLFLQKGILNPYEPTLKMKFKHILFFLFLSQATFANIVLPEIFTSNMVLQQKSTVKIWGWAKSGETIRMSLGWSSETYVAKAEANGNFVFEVKTPSYGGPYDIVLHGYNKVVLSNVLIGEVWLVSGQSNMEWTAGAGIEGGEAEIAKANYPNIRLFTVANSSADYPQKDLNGQWQVCTPETMKQFSAVGYFFAQNINQNLQIPIGIINSSWGGTPAEAWTPAESIASNPILQKDAAALQEVPWGPVKTATLYNGMIHPIVSYKIKGALWYQGEANVVHASHYDLLLNNMITSWRGKWGYEFPFYLVQIAPYKYGQPEEGVILRNAQRMVEKNTPNTHMVVISDIGNINDIHPRNKKDVGERLANAAMKNEYYGSVKPISGPKLLTYELKNGKIILYFDSPVLNCGRECENQFEIADTSGEFKEAKVRVRSNTVTLSNSRINYPQFARFAWGNISESKLTDKDNLPASSFVTDNWWEFKGF